MTYNPETLGGYISRPLCHLYTYNLHRGSLKPHFIVISATTAPHLRAKTPQWSRQNNQKCRDAGKRSEKLASQGVDKGNDMN